MWGSIADPRGDSAVQMEGGTVLREVASPSMHCRRRGGLYARPRRRIDGNSGSGGVSWIRDASKGYACDYSICDRGYGSGCCATAWSRYGDSWSRIACARGHDRDQGDSTGRYRGVCGGIY